VAVRSQGRWELAAVEKEQEPNEEARWDFSWRDNTADTGDDEFPMDACYQDGIYYVAGKFQDSAIGD